LLIVCKVIFGLMNEPNGQSAEIWAQASQVRPISFLLFCLVIRLNNFI
jgi:hypothetical protein